MVGTPIQLSYLSGIDEKQELHTKAEEVLTHLLTAQSVYRECGTLSVKESEDAFTAAEQAVYEYLFLGLRHALPLLRSSLKEVLREVDPEVTHIFVAEMFTHPDSHDESVFRIARDLVFPLAMQTNKGTGKGTTA